MPVLRNTRGGTGTGMDLGAAGRTRPQRASSVRER